MKFAIASAQETTSTHLLERQIRKLEHIVASIHTVERTTELITLQEAEQFIHQLKNNYSSLQITTEIRFSKNEQLTKQTLELLLNNLVDNSFKYKATRVEIRLICETSVELSVSDDGMGIPKEEQQHIFEKYYRISRNENHEINGLGVGLYLVKKTVEENNGTIEVIKKVIAKKAIGAIATHDIEVCLTTNEYPNILTNKCFEVEIIADELHFDYKLRDGICKNKSATFLMKKMGVI
mgnify:CR=1 FL=1